MPRVVIPSRAMKSLRPNVGEKGWTVSALHALYREVTISHFCGCVLKILAEKGPQVVLFTPLPVRHSRAMKFPGQDNTLVAVLTTSTMTVSCAVTKSGHFMPISVVVTQLVVKILVE